MTVSRTLLVLSATAGLAVFRPGHVAASGPSFVATLQQAPLESRDDFLLRVGAYLADRQELTGHEACGNICRADDGRLGVMLFTSHGRTWCQLSFGCPLSHPHLTADSIHSHRSLAGSWNFSRLDYELGPGYLVRGRRMFYQDGPGTAAPFPPESRGKL